MNVAIAFRDALQNGGPGDLFEAIRDTDPARGPLFSISILPFVLVFGDDSRSGCSPNIALAPILYLAAGQIAWIIFRNGTPPGCWRSSSSRRCRSSSAFTTKFSRTSCW